MLNAFASIRQSPKSAGDGLTLVRGEPAATNALRPIMTRPRAHRARRAGVAPMRGSPCHRDAGLRVKRMTLERQCRRGAVALPKACEVSANCRPRMRGPAIAMERALKPAPTFDL